MRGFSKTTLFSLTVISIFILSSFGVTADPDWKINSSTTPTITISVEEAYYADLDQDGLEDDVFTRIELTLSGANRYNLEYWLTLTLPSGQEFVFGWGINTRLLFLNIGNNLYNTALESGWYHLHVEVLMKTGGISYTDTDHTFDPPGGSEGAPPYASFALL